MTKIVHLCLASFYIDGYSYQENLLPKWHKRLGYDVEIIASQETFDSNGRITCFPRGERTYINEYGIKTTRIDYKYKSRPLQRLRVYTGLANKLAESQPDILFIHGPQFYDMTKVESYVRANPNVRVFVDSHADYTNSATNWFSKHVLHKCLWRHMARLIEPYTVRFWGVLPARVDFLIENYDLPREKCDLLVMGADDDEVIRASVTSLRTSIRESLGVSDKDFLVVTGGKIDEAKRQTLFLMDAVKCLAEEGRNIRLLVFGTVVPELQNEFMKRVDGETIAYAGWANTSESYNLFAAANLACFPGRHSVYWEQVVGLGIPLIVKRWDGTNHVDACKNVIFLDESSTESITSALKTALEDYLGKRMLWHNAKKAASSFLYSDIARRSIDIETTIM